MTLSDISINNRMEPPYPPPDASPQYSKFLKDTGPEYIRHCLNLLVYVWTIHRNSFWMYLVDTGGNVLFGYAWDGSDWKYIRFDVDLVDSFC